MRRISAVLAAAVVAAATAASAAEQVEIPLGDSTLPGVLYRPEGPGPFPGVVALHGCFGLVNATGKVARGMADWGEQLAAAGFAVLFPDSFSTRGLTSQCRTRARKVRPARERVADANAARRWLQEQTFVVKDRISLVGWAEGGRASLLSRFQSREFSLAHDHRGHPQRRWLRQRAFRHQRCRARRRPQARAAVDRAVAPRGFA